MVSQTRLIFDYPTISSVAGYAAEQLGAVTMAMPSAMAGAAETSWIWIQYVLRG